jgi:hypothetical protein
MMSKKNEVVAAQSTAVAMPADLLAQMAADAKESAALERPAVGGISFRAGVLSYQGEQVKGNKLRVVVVSASYINTLYLNKWDPDTPTNPDCFALSETGADMCPHGNVPNPPSSKCDVCPNFQWGSDVRDGKPAKGKRCKESRRIVVLPESALDSPEDIAAAELAMLRLPVTSVKAWGGFVNTLAATVNLPYYAVVTEITTQPDIKTQFKVVMTPVAHIQDADILRAIMAKREEAKRISMMPFDSAGNDEAEETTVAGQKF